MRDVKICIVGPSKRFLSGISYYTIRLANALSGSSNVSVICFRKLLPEFLFPGRMHVGKDISQLEFSPAIRVFDGMDYNNPLTWYGVYRYLRAVKPDIIILQWWTSSVSHMHILLKIMSIPLKPKLIIEFHEVVDPIEESILPFRIYSRIMGTILRKNLNGYIVHSISDKFLVAQRYKIDPQKIHVISHGLYDHYGDRIKNKKANYILSIEEEFVILSFGLIRRYKGIPYLIQAFEQLPESIAKRSRLLIVGEIWEGREELINQIKSSIYREKITLVNKYIPDNMVPVYFSAANIVVLPYIRASQSGIAHIAMSFGKPMIVSEVGGLKESMGNYEGTFFVPPENTEAIKLQLIKHFGSEKIYSTPALGWNITSKLYLKTISEII
ncbi:MAG: glycosyltransferase [Candidatus Methanoperedens sp.]|nr:glycosyltransferase [Candidatus Methanoperedens sp.]MCE8428765.1 glycosyltransferase [Candidatus Methanoperedens sp.]